MSIHRDETPKGLRVIKTGRSLEEINQAAKNGYRPLVKKVEPSKDILSKFTVFQHKETGEIVPITDGRVVLHYSRKEEYQKVIEKTFYYPYNFKSPFAAYLVPSDIKEGEEVYLEDLIEDYIGFRWNQGVSKRLKSCEAKWNGEDFEVLYSRARVKFIMG